MKTFAAPPTPLHGFWGPLKNSSEEHNLKTIDVDHVFHNITDTWLFSSNLNTISDVKSCFYQ